MRNAQIKPLISLAGAFYLRGVSKVAKGNFGCTAAPLNRKKHAEHVFIHDPRRVFRAALLSKLGLACLLTALLALPHCENDDNGGGGGEATLDAIYL